LIKKVVGYSGDITFQTDMPDGAPRKLMDIRRLNGLGWSPKVDLESGLALAYKDFLMSEALKI
jgi:GDP-L-fucose synthase